jgi:hypothetical protein
MNDIKLASQGVRLGASEDRPDEYRSVSTLAVVSLVIGLASVLALGFSLFWFVPVLGVGCSLVALARIRSRTARKAGTGAALIGLSLSLIFGAWAVTQDVVRQRTLAALAEPYATGWLQRICDGNLAEAHQMYMEPSRRRPPGTDLLRYYAENESAEREKTAMFAERPLRELAQHGADGSLTYLGVQKSWRDEGVDFLVLGYLFKYEDDGRPAQFQLNVVMRRFFDPIEGIAVWSMHDVSAERGTRSG